MTQHRFSLNCGHVRRIIALSFVLLAAFTFALPAAPTFRKLVLSREKYRVPNSTPLRFGSFGQPAFNDHNNAGFYSTIFGQGVSSGSNAAIFSRYGHLNKLVAREGVATTVNVVATGSTPAFSYTDFFDSMTTNPLMNKQNRLFYSGTYFIGPPISEFFTDYNFATRNTASYNFFTVSNTQVGMEPISDFNSKNNVSLLALYTGVLNNPLTIFRASATSLIGLVSVGDTAIGLPLGSTYATFGTPTLDEKNNVYFVASVTGTGASFDGVWYGKTGDPQPLVLINQKAPGGPAATFTAFTDSPCASPNGKLCAFAATAGATSGIWVVNVSSGVVSSIVVNGVTRAAGLTGAALASAQPPAINDNGQIAFLASPVVGTAAQLGLYMGKSPTTIERIVSVGDTFQINGDAAKVIDLRFSPLGGLNAHGRMIVTLSFDNRTSGIFIATP